MMPIYLMYLVFTIVFLTVLNKMPRIYQLILIITLATIFSSFNNLTFLKSLIYGLINGSVSLVDFLTSLFYMYLAAWKYWDESLSSYVSMIDKDKMKSIAGISITFSMDILYWFVLGLLLYYIFIVFKDVVIYLLRININREREKEIDFFILLVSLSLSFIIGYFIISFEGMFSLFGLLDQLPFIKSYFFNSS